jgi:hypothetical protein
MSEVDFLEPAKDPCLLGLLCLLSSIETFLKKPFSLWLSFDARPLLLGKNLFRRFKIELLAEGELPKLEIPESFLLGAEDLRPSWIQALTST